MNRVSLCYDRTGNTLTVWFDNPCREYICEEIADDIIVMKDRRGRVLGFERLNHLTRKQLGQRVNIAVEVQAT